MKLYSNVTIIFFIWVLSVLTVSYFGFSSLPHSDLFPNDFLRSLANWDGGHYLGIAELRYKYNHQYVFFPLYPLLINFVSKFTGNFLTAGILISVLSSFLAFQLFFKLVLIDFGRDYAKRAILALLFFPMSFYFLTVYTEGLFFLLAVATFLFARKGNYVWACLFAALASATRVTGLAVVFGLVVNAFFTGGISRKNWFVLLSPTGFILYCIYLYIQTGDPFYFIAAQSHFWSSGLVFPGSALAFSFKQLINPGFIINNFRNLLDFIFAVFGIFMVWRVWKVMSLDLAIYSMISLVLPLFSPTIVAIPRYLLTIFPIFIAFGLYKNQYLSIVYQVICLMLLSVYTILFINGFWTS